MSEARKYEMELSADRVLMEYPAEEKKKSQNRFQGRRLSMEERERLGVARYYRPFCVERDTVLKNRRNFWICKRTLDICLSAAALLVLAPLMGLIMLLIFLEDPHSSPIFVQDRVGRGGRIFRFYKLRSMYTGSEKRLEELLAHNECGQKAFKIKDDPRITRVGRFIRNTSIDELAQLVNVLKGDMSIVGPRPPLPREVALYDEYEKQRFIVTPGLTCFWQVYPGRHEISFDDWVALDIKYTVERSLLVDLKLVCRTIGYVLKGHAD